MPDLLLIGGTGFLSGTIAHPWQLAALVGIAGFLLFASWTLLWRELRPE